MNPAPTSYKDILKEILAKIEGREAQVKRIETEIEKKHSFKENDKGFLQSPSQQSSEYFPRISEDISWEKMKEDFDGQEIMIKDITKQWEELADLWLVCERDARQATKHKRLFRNTNWVFGGIVALIVGILLIQTAPNAPKSNQQNWREIIGFLFTGGGVVSTTGGFIVNRLDKYTDFGALRQRSVDLRSLKEDVSNHMTDIKIQLKHYFYQKFAQNNQAQNNLGFDDFYEKYIQGN